MINVNPQPVGDESVTQKAPLGTRWSDGAGREYIYLKAGEALVANDLLTYAASGAVTLRAVKSLEAAIIDGDHIAVTSIAVTIAYFFWATIVNPSISIAANTNCPVDVPLYGTATAGEIDDSGTTKIHGIHCHTAESAGSGIIGASILYPHAAN